MISVSIYGQELDLYQNTQIEYVLNNPAFVGGDISKFNGTYSLPFTIPLTPRNRRILRYPDRVDNHTRMVRDEPCQVFFDRKPDFSGLATVKSPVKSQAKHQAKMYIVQDNFKSFKDNSLRDLPLGEYEFDSSESTLAHAKQTAENHLAFTHAFFPVRNPRMTDDFEDLEVISGVPHHYINYYDYMEENFMNHPSQRSAAPFVRLDHLINIIGQVSGKAIVNNFALDDELKSLYLYGDRNIYTNTNDEEDSSEYTWPTFFDLSQQLPDIKVAEFMKQLANLFCLGLFPSADGLEILPLKNLISRPYAQDWTRYADDAFSKDEDVDFPGTFGYESSGDELFNDNAYVFRDVPEIIGPRPPAGSPDGIYYNYEGNYYLRLINDGHLPQNLDKMFRRVTFDEYGKPYLSAASPLFMTFSDPFYPSVPEILSPPNSNVDLRFIFYRGMKELNTGQHFPLATNHVYCPVHGRLVGTNYSLLWNGEEGMFNIWWSEWANFLKNKRNVFRTMHLPIREIFNMSWKNKVKIENMTYLVKQLKVTLTMKGLKPSKATLVSVL